MNAAINDPSRVAELAGPPPAGEAVKAETTPAPIAAEAAPGAPVVQAQPAVKVAPVDQAIVTDWVAEAERAADIQEQKAYVQTLAFNHRLQQRQEQRREQQPTFLGYVEQSTILTPADNINALLPEYLRPAALPAGSPEPVPATAESRAS